MELESKDTFDFIDMVDYLKTGSKVSRVVWNEEMYIVVNNGIIANSSNAYGYTFKEEDLFADDWYIVIE